MTTTTATQDVSADDLRALLATVRDLRARTSDASVADATAVAARLDASVIRPLAGLLGDALDTPSAAVSANADGATLDAAAFDAALSDLARGTTALCAARRCPPALLEATAALQDLALQSAAAISADAAAGRLAELRLVLGDVQPSIRLEANGPLLVTNVDDVHDWLGCALPARPLIALCRCGLSATKPFCDGSHAQGFDDAKDPARVPDRRDTYVGVQVTILDNRGTCQHAGLCSDRLKTVFRTKEEPFVAPSGGRMDEIIRAVRDCPSGALSYALDGVEARADVDHHGTRAPSIEVTKDGPYRVHGGVALLDANGDEVARNAGASTEHYALCRCGHAQNKPFCTGMHWYVEFRDPVPAPDATPTMFEWAGGLPALTRMTRLFYEKFVPADDLLAPLFAEMSADHPQRVAKWLGEVFGGPPCYSDEYGGYPRMLSQHLGKCLTEEMRARWVTLLLQSAREAGLPNDPEFRSAFQAYIEWGSRLAVENSQTEAHPPQHMPMPHWDWHTSAGPPGSRISALAPTTEPTEPPPTLPGANEPVSFEKHIKTLFRARDRKSMQFAFDLWSHIDVNTHADAILTRVRNGTMPCDKPWPQDWTETFARWITEGKRE
ncbi:MAG: CDGSH iron-sulfur domain-containing protein [Candidatus Eremiobacteraeota bacterium]|nr:CDGSH iron-sulfur domain-containing protein [Candidatus Eremiobacteraeota bacterium]MBV9407893.1 CDGSH iron-sulfur domain-containing protein [Candidatus Eremiobacteraeota bacterium]